MHTDSQIKIRYHWKKYKKKKDKKEALRKKKAAAAAAKKKRTGIYRSPVSTVTPPK